MSSRIFWHRQGSFRELPGQGSQDRVSKHCSRMGTTRLRSTVRPDARAFGAYIRLLRENFHAKGRGKGLRQLAREAGIAPSVLSRGERGLQDLRLVEYIDRLAPQLGVRPSVLKRVAALITPQDVEDFRRLDAGLGAADFRQDGASRLLWTQVTQELQRLRGTSPETLEALLAYIEYLAGRDGRRSMGEPIGTGASRGEGRSQV